MLVGVHVAEAPHVSTSHQPLQPSLSPHALPVHVGVQTHWPPLQCPGLPPIVQLFALLAWLHVIAVHVSVVQGLPSSHCAGLVHWTQAPPLQYGLGALHVCVRIHARQPVVCIWQVCTAVPLHCLVSAAAHSFVQAGTHWPPLQVGVEPLQAAALCQ